ncbi:hypothetical protein P7H15_25430, partial [Paenibacillus larvae]
MIKSETQQSIKFCESWLKENENEPKPNPWYGQKKLNPRCQIEKSWGIGTDRIPIEGNEEYFPRPEWIQ